MLFFWIIIIAVISTIWALVSFKREKSKKEINHVKEKISHGRVIFHSSEISESSSS